MNREQRERGAAMLLLGALVVWFHHWVPALFVAAFVLWVILHERLEGDLGQSLLRRWRRLWPPRALVLVSLLLGVTFAFWIAVIPVRAKVMPVTLNLLALSILSFGNWWRLFPRPRVSANRAGKLPQKGGPTSCWNTSFTSVRC
jgi:hypothetical protein